MEDTIRASYCREIRKELGKCTEQQIKSFNRLQPDGIENIENSVLDIILQIVINTIAKNKEERKR